MNTAVDANPDPVLRPGVLAPPRRRLRRPAPGRLSGADIVAVAIGMPAIAFALWLLDGGLGLVTSGVEGALTGVGQLTGLASGLAALAGLALASRLRRLERRYGLDGMFGWHRWAGIVTVVTLVVHAGALVAAYSMRSGRNPWSEVVFLFGEPWLPAAMVAGGIMVLVGLTSWHRIKATMSYETWYYLHILGYLTVVLALGHVLTTGSAFVANPWARGWWIAMYAGVGLMVVVGRLGPLIWSLLHPLKVTGIERLGDGAISLWVGGRGLRKVSADAGQFFSLRFGVRGLWWQSHPYSLSSAPWEEGLRFTFHARGDDAVAFARIKRGSRVWLQGPYGTLTAEVAAGEPVALIAGGGGIAPLRSILEDVRPEQRPELIFRVSAAHQAWFVHELEHLLAGRGGRLHLVGGRRESLRIDPFAAPSLQALVPDIAARQVFICGPTAMTRAASRGLRDAGVPRGSIHTERYEY